MDTKLTLKLNQEIIERAKKYASGKKVSLSRLIENYLSSLTFQEKEDIEISLFVKSLSDKLDLPIDYDYREDYGKYLSQKFNLFLL